MVDLQMGSVEPEKKPEITEEDSSKKLVFGDTTNSNGSDGIKIEDSPKKRWKLFAIIGGFVALMIGISVAMNWQSITQNFTGNLIGNKQEPLNLPKGTVYYDAYQAADGTVYLKVPYWNCSGGYKPDTSKPGSAGKSGSCTYDSGHTQPNAYWDCPAGYDQEPNPGECSKKPSISIDTSIKTNPNDILNAPETIVKGTNLTPELKCPIGSKPQGKVCVPAVDDGAAIAAQETCPDGSPKKLLATGKTTCDMIAQKKESTCPDGSPKQLLANGKTTCDIKKPASKPGRSEATDTRGDKTKPTCTGDQELYLKADGTYICRGLATSKPVCKSNETLVLTADGKSVCKALTAVASTQPTCKSDQYYDETKKACISNTNLACTALPAKITYYKDALLQENTKDKSAIQIEVLEFLFTKAVQEAMDQSCTVNDEYKGAEKCTDKESFDKKTGACKSAPGYTKVGNNSDEYDCTEVESAITAIDLQLLSDNLNNIEKSALTSLKLDLVNGKEYCKTQGGTSGGGTSGGGTSGGGGGGGGGGSSSGGGGSASSSSKTFEIKNVKVQPEEFNPFAENTTVYFFITQDAYVTLQVLDGTQVIYTTKEEKMNAGDRNLSWDGKKTQGGFVSEKDYTLKIIAKKATNKKTKVEEEADVTVKYFDVNLDLPKDPSFEGDSGTVTFTGTGTGSGSGTGTGSGTGFSGNGTGFGSAGTGNGTSFSDSHGTAGPLAQNIYSEGKGKNTTSKTGPETVMYALLVLASITVVFAKPVKKHRKKSC